jgi:uncharacterized protein (TIGR00269 family)
MSRVKLLGECSRCRGKPFYSRRYSGEVLCQSCFKDSIVEKTRKTIFRYGMIRRGERVAVAVSGGKDSLSLLMVMDILSKERNFDLIAVSVDEGVEGYRGEALAHSKSLSQELGVEHLVISYKELFGFSLDEALSWKDKRDVSSCSLCGVFRRRAIDEAAMRAEVSVVATAHNLDDFVQTFVMNLLHGDVERLAWLDPSYAREEFRLRRVKPFIRIYEEEIALFAYQSGIPFQSVSCPYMHEGLRSEVRDYLNELEARHPGMKNVIMGSALDVISRFSGASEKQCLLCTGCGKLSSSGLCCVCRVKNLLKQHVNYTG